MKQQYTPIDLFNYIAIDVRFRSKLFMGYECTPSNKLVFRVFTLSHLIDDIQFPPTKRKIQLNYCLIIRAAYYK